MCAVMWHRLSEDQVKFWCNSCMMNGHNCSFSCLQWGISKFLSLRVTKDGEKCQEVNWVVKQKLREDIKVTEEKVKKDLEEARRRKHVRKRVGRGLGSSRRQQLKGLGEQEMFDSLLSNPENSIASLKHSSRLGRSGRCRRRRRWFLQDNPREWGR